MRFIALTVQIPLQLLQSLNDVKGFNKETFGAIHLSGEQITSVRLNLAKPVSQFTNFPFPLSKVPWCSTGYYLESRPSFTFDPLFHAGCYYVQEASSMFLEQALKQTADLSKSLKILDLCAAPGGKSTHIQSLISTDSLLVSNEVIRSRTNILKDNIIKWGCENVVVTNNDPKDFSKLENYFDVIVVDAPCSGSGLFRKEPEAINEWSEANVQHCSQRQQRILADVWPALKQGGVLIYSTCSYSKQEDEDIAGWLQQEVKAQYCPLQINTDWGIIDCGNGYRFWPDKVKGEGFFISCFKKTEGADFSQLKPKKKIEQLSRSEIDIVGKWVKTAGKMFVKNQQTVYAWPQTYFNDYSLLLNQLRVTYSGVLVGELMRDKLVPDHALAMNGIASNEISRAELNYEQAISYLQRKDLVVNETGKGWQLVTYHGYPLGWVNLLPNRINNYYPKELRILKDK